MVVSLQWQRLQSPLHHLQSHSLASHAGWSIIVPGLLRRSMKPGHIHHLFLREVLTHIKSQDPKDVVNFIVVAFAKLAKSNSVLMGLKVSHDDRLKRIDIILDARRRYQE